MASHGLWLQTTLSGIPEDQSDAGAGGFLPLDPRILNKAVIFRAIDAREAIGRYLRKGLDKIEKPRLRAACAKEPFVIE